MSLALARDTGRNWLAKLPPPRTWLETVQAQFPVRDSSNASVRHYIILGFLTIAALFGGIGGWAATTDLAGAVIAPGTVVVANNVKKVQHPSGGVISQILVKNGDTVKAGDIVVRLDPTVTRASLQVITKQIDELAGRVARLKAERDDLPSVVFPSELIARAKEPDVAAILSGEKGLFESHTSTTKAQKQQLDERIAGFEQEIAGNTAQAQSKAREIDLIKKQLASLEGLESQQLVSTEKMMQTRRELTRIEGEMAQLTAAAGQSKGKIAEIEIQKLTIDSQSKSDTVKDLREAEGKVVELTERRIAAEDQLKRIDIRSPADGIVDQMTVFTVGGVINTAEPLMVIVPQNDQLVIEAKIAPHDIDQARAHRQAVIRLPAFNQRTTPSLNGNVISISAELTKEQQTGMQYYIARVKIEDDELRRLGTLELVPGMPAEVQIRTTERSALSYLMKPLEDAFAKSFKER
jgi:HlyD family secretion protein